MRTYLPHFVCAGALVFVAFLSRVLLRSCLRSWWQQPLVQFAQRWAPRFGLLCLAVWMLGTSQQNYTLIMLGASLVVAVLIAAMMSLAALPFAIGLHALQARAVHQPNKKTESAPVLTRREFLQRSAAALPLLSSASGLSGMVKSFEDVRLPVFHFKFSNLPAALHGLKICQLSDMHLGYFRGLQDMERLFEKVAAHRPDLVLVTGDLADDLTLLPGLLHLLAQFKAPLGVFAALGNHEYYRGIKNVRKIFDAGMIPLLCEQGVLISVNDARLFIGATDDPSNSQFPDLQEFYRNTAAASLANAPTEAFKILMSHRPQAFIAAEKMGAQLTLAGHTHGMQIGYDGRSLPELFGRNKFLWGHYKRGEAQLYTTSGVGHWFPFRLGCPPEAPIIVLEQAARS